VSANCLTRWRRYAGRAATPVVAVSLLAGVGLAVGPALPAGAADDTAAAASAGCRHPVVRPVGPFRIATDRRTVRDHRGTAFISYGTTVPGLSSPTFATDPNFVRNVVDDKDIPKIGATARVWCGNTVRLQVSQFNVTTAHPTCEAGFLRRALDPEVRAAQRHHLVVVINDNTESDPLAGLKRDPTKATFTFWKCVSQHREDWPGGVAYGRDHQVILDVFNEPRADSCLRDAGGKGPNGPYDMNLWRNGLSYTGCGQSRVLYQGMDAVVSHLRQDGAQNLLWVEGPGNGNTLAGLTPRDRSFLINDPLHRVVYAIHHPYAAPGTPADSATWWKEFGYLVDHSASRGVAPVVVGEWTNFSAAQSNMPYCWSNAPTSVPAFLSYLKKSRVGLSGYELSAGTLLTTSGPPWTRTTNYTDHRWKPGYCRHSSGPRPPLMSAGHDILTWFRDQD
jgi:hypothetical protein